MFITMNYFTTTLLLFLLIHFRPILCDSNEICYDFNLPHQEDDSREDYRLFSTKTTYLTARKEIKKIFDSKWPLEINRCTPIYIFFLNRHSIRYPGEKTIKKLDAILHSFRSELLFSGKLNYKLFTYLATWKFKMVESDDNRISSSGKLETAQTAKFFYKYFPTLFDIDNTTFEIGISQKVRTEETADAFIDSLIDEQLPNDLRSNLTLKNEIKKKKFKKITKDLLLTHKQCKNMIKSHGSKIPQSEDYIRMIESKPIRQMLINFSQRVGLQYTISIDTMILVYKGCSFETALFGFSPWCHLFTRSELKTIEYLLDIDEYHDAYEVTPHKKLACTIVNDLQAKLKSIMEHKSETNATLYFSHENLLSKVMSYFDLFKKFPKNYNMQHNMDKFCIPEDRQWRTSLIVPFGTNFVVVLYKCPRIDLKNDSLKLLTLVNEIPVVVRGCDNSLCDIEKFFQEFQQDTNECDLQQICKI